jgi:thiamine biosynthesis lipoprotein
MSRAYRSAALLAALGSLAALGVALPARAAEPAAVERRVSVMGTLLGVEAFAETRGAALRASEAAVEEIEAAEALLSTWRSGTPLARLNAAPAGVATPIPPELAAVLSDAFTLSERTGHAFEPAILPLVRAWGLRTGGRVPIQSELESARRAVAPGAFAIDRAHATATRLRPDAAIDEGAWGKGWALDRAAAALRARGATGFLDLGGQVLAVGDGVRRVELAHPRHRAKTVLTLSIAEASVSTSGDGERPGHLLDPKSGRPAPDFGSVAVIAKTGFIADVLSTALFVLGPDEGRAASARLVREGVTHEYVFLVDRGDRIEILASPGARSQIVHCEGDLGCPK